MATIQLEDRLDRIRPHAASNLLLWSISGFLGIFLIWAALTQLDRTVRGPGRVIPSAQLQTVSNLEGGIVSAILVRTGQMVRAGAPLIRLDRTQTGSEYDSSQAAFDALNVRIARLEAEVAGRAISFPTGTDPVTTEQIAIERSLHLARMADLASLTSASQARVTQAERGVAEAAAALDARQAARASSARQLEMIRPLVDRGIEPRMSLVQTESAAAIAAGEAAQAGAALARARSAVAETRATLTQQRQDWRARAADELATAQAERAGRRRALPALADRVRRTIVRAPLDGRINRVLVATVGGSIRPSEPIAEIVPSDNALFIETMISPKDIAFVRLGQQARVGVTAYESAVYGSLEGRVVSISPDAVVSERTGESHYLVRVRTARPALIDALGRKLPIGPGMIADVSLLGDKRSVLAYILTPITRLGETALRE